MIYTSSYRYYVPQDSSINFYSISGDRGQKVGYTGPCFSQLAPRLSFWKVWQDNIGKIPEHENNEYYIREYCAQTLSQLNPLDIYRQLNSSQTILLCYENYNQFCHRHIVAAWLELKIDNVMVPEVIYTNNRISVVNRPNWVKGFLSKIL